MTTKTHFRILFFLLFLSQYTRGQTIDPAIKHQKVEGWGVSLAWWANLAGGMSQSTQDTLAKYAVNDLNFNIFRFNIGGGENANCTAGDHIRKDGGKMPGYRSPQLDNQGLGTYNLANDARQIAMMNKIATLRAAKGDIVTETISYSPPWWMTYGLCSAGNVSATTENLRPEFYDDFADYLVSVTKGLKTTYPSWNLKYIEPFNEPLSGYWQKGGGQEGSAFYPAVQGNVLSFLKSKLQSYGLTDVSLTAADNTSVAQELSNMSTLLNNNPNEYNSLSKICVHSYSGNWQDKANLAAFAAQNGNKTIWQSETGPLSWNLPAGAPDWWVRHYDMAYRLVEDMRNLKASVWCDWQLMSADDGWGMIQQTNWDENNPYKEPILKKTRGFYCRKNVTNFIKKGYQIIESNGTSTLSALSPDNTELVIVAVNNSGAVSNYNLDLRRFSGITGFKTYRTSGGDNSSENTTEKTIASTTEKGVLANNFLSYAAPAYSVTTFVVNISGTFVSVTPPNVPAPLTTGTYYIKAKHSNKYMSVAGFSSTNGAVIEQWENNLQDNLKFELSSDTSGYYKFKPVYNNKLITVAGSSVNNGASVSIDTNLSASNQKFQLISAGNGFYQISPQHAYNKALAVTGNSLDNGADVILWDYIDASDNFKWAFESVNAPIGLAVITAYAASNTNPTPRLVDYTAAGVTGVTESNLTVVNAAIDVANPAPTTLAQVQAVVDQALANQALSININDFETVAPNNVVRYGSDLSIVANPLINATNATAKTARLARTTTNWYELFAFNIDPVAVPANTTYYLHTLVKYDAATDVAIRYDATNRGTDGTNVIRASNPYTAADAGKWKDLVFAIAGGTSGITVNAILFHPDLGFNNSPAVQVLNNSTSFAYIDELLVSNSSTARTSVAAPTLASTLANFDGISPAASSFFGANNAIVANPYANGGNTSANSAKIGRTSTNWYELTRFNIPDFTLLPNETKYIHVAVNYPSLPVASIRVDVDNVSAPSGNVDILPVNTYTTASNSHWQDLVFAVSGGAKGLAVNNLVLLADEGNYAAPPAGQVLDNTSKFAYVDNIVINNSQTPLFTARTGLEAITLYAGINTNPTPRLVDYTTAGVTGVTTGNLGSVNAAIDVANPAPTTLAQVQAIINNINNSFIWTGSTSTDWTVVSNWNNGVLPDLNSDVLIPSGVTFFPTVATNVTIKSLVIKAGSNITVASDFKLTVSGSITNEGTINLSDRANLNLSGQSNANILKNP